MGAQGECGRVLWTTGSEGDVWERDLVQKVLAQVHGIRRRKTICAALGRALFVVDAQEVLILKSIKR